MTPTNEPAAVRVTGEERHHPGLRKLTRALLALARQQLARHAKPAADERPAVSQNVESSPANGGEAGGRP
jgi:hypothetical protein